MSRVPLAALWTTAALAFASLPAGAQRPTLDSLRAGVRVRLSAPPYGRVSGRVLARRADTLVVRRDLDSWGDSSDTLRVLLGDVSALAVSVRRHRRVGKGALIGLMVGAAAGAVVGAATYKPTYIDPGRGGTALIVGVLGGAGGAAVGALVGAVKVDKWEAVALRRQ